MLAHLDRSEGGWTWYFRLVGSRDAVRREAAWRVLGDIRRRRFPPANAQLGLAGLKAGEQQQRRRKNNGGATDGARTRKQAPTDRGKGRKGNIRKPKSPQDAAKALTSSAKRRQRAKRRKAQG